MPLFNETIFAVAHTNLKSAPFNNQGRTLRLVVPCNRTVKALSVLFSNSEGEAALSIGSASLARCDKNGTLQPNSLVPLTVGGKLAFEVTPQEDLCSDEINFSLHAGDFFALNLYYPAEERVNSGNWVSNHSLRSRPGNFSADLQISKTKLAGRLAKVIANSDMTVPITTVKQIIAHCEQEGRVLACFGDSITQQSNWTGPLRMLLHKTYPGEISLCNLGISGNRLLHGGGGYLNNIHGIAGIERFERDVLSIQGLTHCIVAIGTNDIGLPGSDGIPVEELIDTSEYFSAMQNVAQKLKQRGVKVFAATLAPRPVQKQFTEEREQLRKEMNDWIRTADCFDAVLDFDAVLRREDGEAGMQQGCAMADGLHPSVFGGMWLAKSIDLSLFE